MADTDVDFAAMVRMHRAKKQYTQKELAELVGVDTQSVGAWENGTYLPSLQAAVKLADVLQVSLDELAGRATV